MPQLTDISATVAPVNFFISDMDPEQPADNYRFLGMTTNPFAIANGGFGAIILDAALASTPGAANGLAKLDANSNLVNLYPYTPGSLVIADLKGYTRVGTTGWQKHSYRWTAGNPGSLNFYWSVTSPGVNTTYGVSWYKNGVQIGSAPTFGYNVTNTLTQAFSFVPGDYFELYSYTLFAGNVVTVNAAQPKAVHPLSELIS